MLFLFARQNDHRKTAPNVNVRVHWVEEAATPPAAETRHAGAGRRRRKPVPHDPSEGEPMKVAKNTIVTQGNTAQRDTGTLPELQARTQGFGRVGMRRAHA